MAGPRLGSWRTWQLGLRGRVGRAQVEMDPVFDPLTLRHQWKEDARQTAGPAVRAAPSPMSWIAIIAPGFADFSTASRTSAGSCARHPARRFGKTDRPSRR